METEAVIAMDAAFAAPVWWDPKHRKLVFDYSTFVAGLLVVNDGDIALVTPDGIVFTAPCDEVRPTWKRSMVGTCDLNVGERTYLLYFAPPNPGVPRLSRNALTKIGAVLHGSGVAGGFAARNLSGFTGLGDVATFANLAGTALQLAVAASQEHKGRHRAHELRRLLETASASSQVQRPSQATPPPG